MPENIKHIFDCVSVAGIAGTVKGKPNRGVANRRKYQSKEWLSGCDDA